MDKKLKSILIALAVSIIFLQGCTQNNTGRITNPEGAASVVDANNQFAFELYSQYKSQDGNLFFSPYSISTALAMTYEGARGKTADEMISVFQFPKNDSMRRSGFAVIQNEINKKDKEYNLSSANALWAQKGYKFLDEYMNIVDTYYGGKATNLDFIGDTENSRITINRWVEEHTNNKIKDILPPGVINSLTRLVLTNAVYFKAQWLTPFSNNTTDKDFRVSLFKTVKVKMMSLDKEVNNYTETDNAQILELPYKGNEISMLILLPKGDNLQALEQSLSANKLKEWRGMLKETELDGVYVPRFKFETKYFLKDTLMDMGMKTAFTWPGANFSGMDGTTNLYITAVIHQAFVDVNETGTEAAAATVVIEAMGAAINAPPKPVFRADHPFIFIIQQRDTGNILFMGRVSDPTTG
jgi:serpin B